MATAIQILCILAYKDPDPATAEIMARSLRTNPVVVRRLVKTLQRAGLVTIRPGRDGGIRLARAADTVTLDQVHRAVEAAAAVFAVRPEGSPSCPVAIQMPALLPPVFEETERAIEGVLRQRTLASLVAEISR